MINRKTEKYKLFAAAKQVANMRLDEMCAYVKIVEILKNFDHLSKERILKTVKFIFDLK